MQRRVRPRVLRVSTAIYHHTPTIRGIAMKRKKKMGDGQRDPKDTRQRIQKKDNAPCHNQLERTKTKGRQEEGNLPLIKLSLEKYFEKNQEATESPMRKPMNSPSTA
jgi:hypothetical protein